MTEEQRETAGRVRVLCRSAAREIWWKRAPETGYAEAVAAMLFMLATHESGGFRFRLQLGYLPTSTGGACGLWQIECAGIMAALTAIGRTAEMRERCETWLAQWGCSLPASTSAAMVVMQRADGDPVGCLIARVYHLLDAVAVPCDLVEMSRYCKAHHNYGGKASAEMYLAAYEKWIRIVEPELEGTS